MNLLISFCFKHVEYCNKKLRIVFYSMRKYIIKIKLPLLRIKMINKNTIIYNLSEAAF